MSINDLMCLHLTTFDVFKMGFPGGTVENLPASAGDSCDLGLIPGSGRSPGEGNGNPLQYSCLGIPMARGAWWATVHWMAEELDLTDQLSKQVQCIQNTLVSHVPINTAW